MGVAQLAGTKREGSASCSRTSYKRQRSAEPRSPASRATHSHRGITHPDSTPTTHSEPPNKIENHQPEQLARIPTPVPLATAKETAHCPSIVPCSDPQCEDGVPCPESTDWCQTLECLGEICYDQDCHFDSPDEGCCDEPCPDGDHCQSPCYSLDCHVATCDEPCREPLPSLPSLPGHVPESISGADSMHGHEIQQAYTAGLDCGCIDPKCLETAPHWHCHDPHHTHMEPLDPVLSSHDSHFAKIQNFEDNSRHQRTYDPHEHFYALLQGTAPSYESNFEAPYPAPATPALTNTSTATPSTCISQTTCSLPPLFESELSCQWILPSTDAEPCGQCFDNAEELHRHVEKAHIEGLAREDTAGNGFFCRWQGCDRFLCRSFQARPKLKRHVQTHTLFKPFICPQCGVQMKTKDAMEKHERTHTGERPYRCQIAGCSSTFATSTELKTHMVVHSGQKPHQCPFCSECFADSSNLSKHKKTHFVGMYRCPECGARMKRWDQMRRHIHTQSHAVFLLQDARAQLEYKARMEREFRELPDDQKTLNVHGGNTRPGFAVV